MCVTVGGLCEEMSSGVKTPVWQYKCFVEWTKSVLLAELLPSEGGTVCALGAAAGVDLGKLQRAKVSRVVVLDTRESLDATKARWQQRKEPFECT